MSGPIASTTSYAITLISNETGIDEKVVERIVDLFLRKIRGAIRAEMPFSVRWLGKFCLSYRHRTLHKVLEEKKDFYKGKISREIKFVPSDDLKGEMHGWVHDFGIKNNTAAELMKMKIQPDALEKLRKKKTLDDQRALGFRADLIFDEPPEVDKIVEKDLSQAPTVEGIIRRIGINLKE